MIPPIFKQYFEYLFPFLLITWAVIFIAGLAGAFDKPGKIRKTAVILISAALAFYHFGGLSLSEYLLSLSPCNSIGTLALLFVVIAEKLGQKKILSSGDLLVFSIWNISLSLVLYCSSLGFVSFDFYKEGYGFAPWFIVPALFTVVLFLLRSPLAYIILGYIAAFDLNILPSDNFLDYITDGFLFLVSLGIVTATILKSSNFKTTKNNA